MALTQVSTNGIADGAVTANDLENSGVTAGTYGSSSAIPAITVDAKGRVTSASTNDLADSGVTAGTYGSSSAIPAITVDAKGRITSASTNSVTQVGGANGVDFNDNVKARFGTGNDFEIYHDGTDNVIATDGPNIRIGTTGETFAKFFNNGAAQLFWDNSQKLSTVSTGIDVTGTVTCDGLVSETGDTIIRNATGKLILRDFSDSGSTSQQYISGLGADAAEDWYLGQTSNANPNVHMVNKQAGEIQFGTNDTFRHAISSAGHWIPQATNAYDLGSNSNQFRDGYFDGTVNCDGLSCAGDATIEAATGILTIKDNDSTGNANSNYIRGRDSGDTTKWYVGHASTSNQDLYVTNSAGGQIQFQSSGTTRFTMQAAGHLVPASNNSIDLGSSGARWRNVYTNDLNLSNEGGSNDVDGTWGAWTIQEGEDDLFLLNRRNGKKYKFNLSEVN